jgi:hypothetical protein
VLCTYFNFNIFISAANSKTIPEINYSGIVPGA